MCQSTKLGGKRCGAHANATLATEMQIAKTTGAPIQKVKHILAMLRKRGKGELPPSAEEVAEYAAQQKFNISHDASLNAHDKRILSNRWDKATKENISGGTWYAVKNGFFAVIAFMKKKVVTGGLIGVMAFSSVSACSGGVEGNEPSIPATSTSAPSEPTTQSHAFKAENVTVGEIVGEGNNKRRELITGNQDDLLTGVKIPSDVSERFSEKEIKESQNVAAAFMVEDILDSGYLQETNPAVVAKWYDDIAPKTEGFLKEQLPTLKANINEQQQPIPASMGNWRGLPDPDRPTKNGSYFDEVDIELSEVSLLTYENKDYIQFNYTLNTKRPVVNVVDTDAKKYDEYMRIAAHAIVSPTTKNFIGYGQSGSTRTVEEGGKPDFSS